jgi:hypothetical protein
MELVINNKHGGFGLSPKAVKRIAELQGKECYFFAQDIKTRKYRPVTVEQASDEFVFYAFTIPNPNEYLGREDKWHSMTLEERQAWNRKYDSVKAVDDYRSGERNDPILLQVVEYQIEEYDGREWVAEAHRTWS